MFTKIAKLFIGQTQIKTQSSAPLAGSLVDGIAPTSLKALRVVGAAKQKPTQKSHDVETKATNFDNRDALNLPCRSPHEQEALVASLQKEFSSNFQAPPKSNTWPVPLLRRWFEDEGRLTVDALATQEAVDMGDKSLIDQVGENYAVTDLKLLDMGQDGILGALRRHDEEALSNMAECLLENKYVATKLVGSNSNWIESLLDESERAWPFMRPGEIFSNDKVIVGLSPSGKKRGDRFVLARSLPGDLRDDWTSIAILDEAMGVVGSAIAKEINDSFPLAHRSDLFIAKFSGDGLGYGAHFDGNEKTKITAIFYTSKWKEGDGGELLLLNEAARQWKKLPPIAGTLVLFRSDEVLHKVMPCFAPRFAFTLFLSLGRTKEDKDKEREALISLMGSYS